jgi:hypothetical protein
VYIFSALVTPKFILKSIKSIQQKIIWKGTKDDRKWALVSWERLCKPKLAGALGLRDPQMLNQILGAKVWSRWLKNLEDLWAKFLR